MRPSQIVLQFDKTHTGDLAATDLSHRYLWGTGVDRILADEQVHYDAGSEDFVTDALLWQRARAKKGRYATRLDPGGSKWHQ